MLNLIERIRERLAQSAYANEAAISHGVVTPVLNALGWDSADPAQVVPEFSIGRGRVDFALFGLGHRPAVIIEVKGVGRAVEGDRQLFEYAFHEGVPLCVLTDGREWSFYLPSGQGNYEDRRVYRLQLDDRDPTECERVLQRYLSRERVRSNVAFEDAQRDYRDAAGKREATAALPRAWADLIAEEQDLLIEIVTDKAEALCGFKPATADVVSFLRGLSHAPAVAQAGGRMRAASADPAPAAEPTDRTIRFTLFGAQMSCESASLALVEVLRAITARDPGKINELADAVRTKKRSLVARSVLAINPGRPDLARAAEFSPGWFIGLNIANREKMAIIRTACKIYSVELPGDLNIRMPHAD